MLLETGCVVLKGNILEAFAIMAKHSMVFLLN